jgi:hypothetical protein
MVNMAMQLAIRLSNNSVVASTEDRLSVSDEIQDVHAPPFSTPCYPVRRWHPDTLTDVSNVLDQTTSPGRSPCKPAPPELGELRGVLIGAPTKYKRKAFKDMEDGKISESEMSESHLTRPTTCRTLFPPPQSLAAGGDEGNQGRERRHNNAGPSMSQEASPAPQKFRTIARESLGQQAPL